MQRVEKEYKELKDITSKKMGQLKKKIKKQLIDEMCLGLVTYRLANLKENLLNVNTFKEKK